MAVPKKKISKSKTRQGRSHDGLTAVNAGVCQNCGEPVVPHQMCQACETYGGKSVKTQKETAEKAAE